MFDEVRVLGFVGRTEKRLCKEADSCSHLGQCVSASNFVLPQYDNDNLTEEHEEEEKVELKGEQLQEGCIGNDSMEIEELINTNVDMLESGIEGENQQDVLQVQVGRSVADEVEENVVVNNGIGERLRKKLDQKTIEEEDAEKVDDSNRTSTDTFSNPHFKQGRRCGLCGGATDGKPPKKLVQDIGESEIDTYSGSSASEEPNYDVWDGFGDEPGWLGRLLGPINDRYGIAGIWVHQHCAVWSPEVYFAGLGCLKNVRAALCRGRALKCTRCGRRGATIGCRVDRCPKTYHLPCARANGCIFDHRKFLIACTDHRHLFQPYGNHYLAHIKKRKAKKMKMEIRKLSNDALRKDVEAEEKWLENCGEDEEFLKRESKRLQRDLLRIAPVYIGGSDYEGGKPFEGWESVAGLQDVIQCMKEVVILPLLYPEFFDNLGLTPPRGVLLHGYPGTGKTLVVRALIGSCARGDKRIAYFARKGADCLGKYVGDAERQLRLLFQVAERCQPSIIFFDEIDGLAPRRTRQQDQTHSSVVSTLLALMDGLKSRGSVVVIGATNRPEAIDPALRRPGRFDREIYFPLPSVEDRAAILSLHTKRWPKPITGSLLKWIAKKTVGFAGADLQALCTQAAIIALKRKFPLQEVLSAAQVKIPGANRVPLPDISVEERDWLEALSRSPPPCSRREAGIPANDLLSYPLPMHLIPCLLHPLSTLFVSLYLDEHLWLPPPLYRAAGIIKSVIVSALKNKRLPSDQWWSHVDNLLQEADVAKEIERRLSYAGILSGGISLDGSDAFMDDSGDDVPNFRPSIMHKSGKTTSLLPNIPSVPRNRSGFRILIAGSPRSGQRHLASCILHCFAGSLEVQKVDLATISQEGHGNVEQGVTRMLMKCASWGSCAVFMPRIDLWALETFDKFPEFESSLADHQSSEKEDLCFTSSQGCKVEKSCLQHCESTGMVEAQTIVRSVSHAWRSFVEQVESICVSTSLIILATSEVPYEALPDGVRQFFRSDLSGSTLAASMQMMPQSIVHLGSNFNRDMTINLSVAELSRAIVQPFVHLIHQRTHIHENLCKEYKPCSSVGDCPDAECPRTGIGLVVGEAEKRSELPDDVTIRVPPSLNKTLKGKSSLLFAISTFGYQILRYPQFAELCWVTSKLKEGPCADVSGPWRGWPFNSCIIRPSSPQEQIAVNISSSGNLKSKEKTGLVRGLIAVGLSAYRGIYTSAREVSFEVRQVLELLVGQINAKVNAGKDRYQYIRLLSQVAFLEDMVNSWAYALQSLGVDAQFEVANPKANTVGSPDTHPNIDSRLPGEECESNISDFSCPRAGLENPNEVTTQEIGCIDLKKEGVNSDSNYEGRIRQAEGSVERIPLCGQSTSNINGSFARLMNNVVGQNGMHSSCEFEVNGNHAALNGDVESLKISDGVTKTIVLSENGNCSSEERGGCKIFYSRKACKQLNGLPSVDDKTDPSGQSGNINFSSKDTSPAADQPVVCLYRCCSRCLCTLQDLLQKMLICEWGLNGSDWIAEDIHDAVASMHMDLFSALRKVYATGSRSDTDEENLADESRGTKFEYPELRTCLCKDIGGGLAAPVECSCHSVNGRVTVENISSSTRYRGDLSFVFRDGALLPIDFNKDQTFHCKFETFCLCSLIKSIIMWKQPLS